MSEEPLLSESVLPSGQPVQMVIRSVALGNPGAIRVRRITPGSEIEWVDVFDDSNDIILQASDRIALTGNARCVVYLWDGSKTQEAVSQIQSVAVDVQFERRLWSPGCPMILPLNLRNVQSQSPPVIDEVDMNLDGIRVRWVLVPGGAFQIEL